MYPNFFALFNKAGIACAADTDHTVFRLSRDLPVAIAVNPASTIPWEAILKSYQRTRKVREHLSMAEYASDFCDYLAAIPVKNNWDGLSSDERNLIFMGFGSRDIYPSLYDFQVEVKDGVLKLGIGESLLVGDGNEAFYCNLGDFDSISTLIMGATEKVRSLFLEKYLELFNSYSDRVREKFRGTDYQDYVEKHLADYDPEQGIGGCLDWVTRDTFSHFKMGVDSFSVEDMVTAVETLVQANAELTHLRSGAKGRSADVREIAVITIPEGLSWVKHSLYYRREEI